ncbi:MAG: SH3 domain-containing protein [Anaerolineae bacterium]
MTQYDAGPGDWSDRPWEDPERKPPNHARRRRLTLPPWALLAILIALIILLCVGLVLIIRAIRGSSEGTPTPTARPTATRAAPATNTVVIIQPTTAEGETPTPTVVLPVGDATAPPTFTEIAPGAPVEVYNTAGAGLNLRAQASTSGRVVLNVKDGTALTVTEGPEEANGYTWWKVETADGTEGWGAANWLRLKTE